MPKTKPNGSRSAAETPPTELHPGQCDRSTLEAACHQYLELRSTQEGLEVEIQRTAKKLGQLNIAIASQLGPLERPMVIETAGMLLVINVAEGLVEPGIVTATVTEALAAGDVLDNAPPPVVACPICKSPDIKPAGDGNAWRCGTCLCLSLAEDVLGHAEVAQ